MINNKDYLHHSRPLFIEMNILNVYKINILQVLCLVYKCLSGNAPRVFHSIFSFKSRGKYTTRSSSRAIEEPFSKRNYELFTFSFRGPRLWNELIANSDELNECESLSIFKNKVKKLLVNTENVLNFF